MSTGQRFAYVQSTALVHRTASASTASTHQNSRICVLVLISCRRIALGAFCICAFAAPAILVSRGFTVAGDKATPTSVADVEKITAQNVHHGTKQHNDK